MGCRRFCRPSNDLQIVFSHFYVDLNSSWSLKRMPVPSIENRELLTEGYILKCRFSL